MFHVGILLQVFLYACILWVNGTRGSGYKCPLPSDCGKANCKTIEPRNCTYGTGWPACGCCVHCLMGPGQPCGLLSGQMACGQGLVCKNEKFVNGHHHAGICQYDGTLRKCLHKPKCTKKCPLVHACRYGSAVPQCECCPVCVRTERQSCDHKNPCGHQFYCKYLFKYNGVAIFPASCHVKAKTKKTKKM